MSKIEQEGKFYDLVFGLLKNKCSSELQKKIWKLIDRLPTSKDKISKLENCKQFIKKNWEEILVPDNMEQLLYIIKIIQNLVVNTEWMNDFLESSGQVVIEELIISLLGSVEPNCQKIVVRLSHILSKLMENSEKF